jgi:hypothetical protein
VTGEKFLDGSYRTVSTLQSAKATVFVLRFAKCDALEKLKADFVRDN